MKKPITHGFALVGRTIRPKYYETEDEAMRAIRVFSDVGLMYDGAIALWQMVNGEWELFYEPEY